MRSKFQALGVVAAALSFALLAAGCSGDTYVTSSGAMQTGISVQGEGRAAGPPDVVVLQIGVDVERPTVAEAQDAAARAMQTVVESLKRNGIEDRNIQTTQFTVTSMLDQNRAVRGYRVANVVGAKITKVDTASKVIDDAAVAGGNAAVIRNIAFSIEDRSKLEAAAREAAVKEARERAEALARHGGVDLGETISMSESQERIISPVQPGAIAAPRTGDVSTPIESGELEVVVRVNVTYAIQ